LSIQKINAIDRVASNVLSNGAIRYGVYDNSGNLLRYEYIKREDEPVEEGTNVNKVLFDKIDDNTEELVGERSRVDRYNIPDVSIGEINKTYYTDLIPKTWGKIDDTNYTSNGIKLSVSRVATGTSASTLAPDKACDGDTSTKWQPQTSNTTEEWLKLDFPYQLKIKKMKTLVGATNATNLTSWSIQGSNDNSNWNSLYTSTSRQTDIEEITLNNNTFYKYYRVYITRNTGTAYVNVAEIQITEWEMVGNKLTLNNKINGYFNNMRTLLNVQSDDSNVTHITTSVIPNMYQNIDGGFTASASSEGNPAYYVRNGLISAVNTSAWQPASDLSSSDNAYWQIEFPFLLRITTLTMRISYWKSNSYLEGLKTNGEWETIASDVGNTSTSTIEKTVTITSENYYKAIRLVTTGYYSASYKRPYLWDFQITEGYMYNYDKRLFTYLNINDLGFKKVNELEDLDKEYELIYDGTEFNAHKSNKQLEKEIAEIQQAIIDLGGVL